MSTSIERLRADLSHQKIQCFAPSDLPLAITLLKEADPKFQRLVGDMLIRTGPPAISAVIQAFDEGDTPMRRAATFILGKLLQQERRSVGLSALRVALKDSDPKVRKNAAVALGGIGDRESVEDLIAQMQIEPMNYVRPSIVLALGEIGGVRSYEALACFSPQTDDDARTQHLALERSGSEEIAPVRLDLNVDVLVDLLCRIGIEPVLEQELLSAGVRYYDTGSGFVRLEWRGRLSELFRFRCYNMFAFPVFTVPEHPLDQPYVVAEMFARSPALQLASLLTDTAEEQGVRYRVTFELPPRTKFSRRDWIGEFAHTLNGLTSRYVNSPGRYSWEFLIRYAKGIWYFGVRPTAVQDPRFVYRVADVPAALNPAVAAAMTRLIPCKETDVVLDPFCGSGTPLVERAVYAPYHLLLGLDNNPNALASAKKNIRAAGIQNVKLIEGDATLLKDVLSRYGHRYVNTIITNPPYGVRVSSADQVRQLYATFFREAVGVLQSEGCIVLLAKEGRAALHAAKDSGFMLNQELRVDTGGIFVSLLVFRRGK